MRDLFCWVCSAEILRSIAMRLGHSALSLHLHKCNIELQKFQHFVIGKRLRQGKIRDKEKENVGMMFGEKLLFPRW